jgi:hypothetical protein
MEPKKRISGVILFTAIFLAAGILMGCGWTFCLSDFFRIDKIEVSGNGFLTDAEMGSLLAPYNLNGRIAYLTDLPDIARSIERNPRIAQASFKKSLPNKVKLTIREEQEFATLVFVDGRRCVIGRTGNFIRGLEPDAPRVGPLICGFTEDILLEEETPYRGFKDEVAAWSGFSPKPEAAGRLRMPAKPDKISILRERIRLTGALKLAEATGIDRKPVASNYKYIGLDGNYDLFLEYDGLPPIVVGGFTDGPEVVSDIAKVVRLEDTAELWGYDFIDMHLSSFGRGVKLAEYRTYTSCEWSDGKEAVRVAAWEIRGEVERRVAK